MIYIIKLLVSVFVSVCLSVCHTIPGVCVCVCICVCTSLFNMTLEIIWSDLLFYSYKKLIHAKQLTRSVSLARDQAAPLRPHLGSQFLFSASRIPTCFASLN